MGSNNRVLQQDVAGDDDTSFWSELLKDKVGEDTLADEEEELGRGMRSRREVSYFGQGKLQMEEIQNGVRFDHICTDWSFRE